MVPPHERQIVGHLVAVVVEQRLGLVTRVEDQTRR